MDRNEVSTAFEIVLEEVESVVDSLNNEGAEAFQKSDYETAKGLIEDATRLTDFRTKVRNLQKEWDTLFHPKLPPRIRTTGKTVKRSYTIRLDRGLRTNNDAFRRPILEALKELNNSATVTEVLERVAGKMKTILNDYDRQPLPSQPKITRWNNNAQWCRNILVQEGLMKADSPRGIWEISEKGEAVLKNKDV